MNNEKIDKENKNERARSEFPSGGLEGMIDYGRRLIDAQYSVSTKISLLQEDIYEIAERSGFSIESIVRRAFGDVRGMDAFAGRSRTILASEGISLIIGTPLSMVTRIVEISVDEAYSDSFKIEFIRGESTFSIGTLDALRDSSLISEDHYEILSDECVTGVSSTFKKGDLVTNIPSDPDVRTASQRICSFVRMRLPPGVRVARVTRADYSDGSIRWQCYSDPSKYGWVSMKGIRHYFSSLPKDNGNEGRDRLGDWM